MKIKRACVGLQAAMFKKWSGFAKNFKEVRRNQPLRYCKKSIPGRGYSPCKDPKT